MSGSNSENAVDARLALAEKAIAEMNRRIEELSSALAGTLGKGDTANRGSRKEVVVSAETISPFSSGFYQCERDSGGRPYRWTGQRDVFEIRLPLDRDVEWSFSADIRGNDYVNIRLLKAFVDYIEVPIEFRGGNLVCGSIPRRLFSDRAIVSFFVPKHFTPKQIDPASTDTRRLGVVFRELKATPKKSAGDRAMSGLVPKAAVRRLLRHIRTKKNSVARGLATNMAPLLIPAKLPGAVGTAHSLNLD